MAQQFRLVRYFTLASVGMFAAVAIALAYFERQQASFIQQMQRGELDFVKQVQDGFARQQEQVARADLLAAQENGNVDLARLFANTLWQHDFGPFVAKVAAIPVDPCRAIADVQGADGRMSAPKDKKACFAEVGAKIRALPEFPALDAKVIDTMRRSSVFKIKVFDARGITAYSSEHAQIGDDKAANAGWLGASSGTPRSELTHRDKFSAFEGVVENRDLISSYLPVYPPGSTSVAGVFEVYSDVTPLLARIKATSASIAQAARANQARMEQSAASGFSEVDALATRGLAIVAVLLVVLFGALFVIVRRADAILVRQQRERELDHQKLAQSEKMASLGQMVAGVAHQLNTPLAFSRSNISMVQDGIAQFRLPLKVAHAFAQAVRRTEGDAVTVNVHGWRPQLETIEDSDGDIEMLSQMLGDTLQGIDQMAELVENLRDFTRLDRARTTQFDLNKGLHTVAYIARSAIPHRVSVVEEFGELPLVECNPSQLNQVFLNLINNAAQSIPGEGRVTVRSAVDGDRVRIDVTDTGTGIPEEVRPHIFDTFFTTKPAGEGTGLGLPIVKSIVEEHGGEVKFRTRIGEGSTFTVFLPVALAEAEPA
ncbi:MAG TPA: HAMP domain-containing sensor histidine kinase [Ramlibacter sp.]|nr:HAMP domain-containing sensor histidine kinase [Ramlibacter sp.]